MVTDRDKTNNEQILVQDVTNTIQKITNKLILWVYDQYRVCLYELVLLPWELNLIINTAKGHSKN